MVIGGALMSLLQILQGMPFERKMGPSRPPNTEVEQPPLVKHTPTACFTDLDGGSPPESHVLQLPDPPFKHHPCRSTESMISCCVSLGPSSSFSLVQPRKNPAEQEATRSKGHRYERSDRTLTTRGSWPYY